MTVLTRYLASSGMTNLADGISLVAWAWLASLLTRDPLYIALVPIALKLPGVLLSLPAGLLADRFDRRRLIIVMDLLRAATLTFLTLALLTTPIGAPALRGVDQTGLFALLVLCGLVIGGAEVIRDNTAQSFLPSLVAADTLEEVNGRLGSIELVGNSLIGPALGGVLIAAFVALPFAINATAYGLAALFLLSIPAISPRPVPRQTGPALPALAEAARFLWNTPVLRVFALCAAGWNLIFQIKAVAIVLHVQENMNLEAGAYGVIMIGGAVGGIAGGVIAGHVIRSFGRQKTAQLALLSSVPAFLGVALAPGPIALACAIALIEFPGVIWNAISISQRQRLTPSESLGRVNSMYRLFAYIAIPTGMLLSGLSVRWAETVLPRDAALTVPFWIATLGSLVIAAYGWPAMRRAYQSLPQGQR